MWFYPQISSSIIAQSLLVFYALYAELSEKSHAEIVPNDHGVLTISFRF